MSDTTPGPWEPCILDRPLADIPDYVAECIARSGGTDFFFIRGQDEHGVCDVAHVGNGPRALANARLIASAPALSAEIERLAAENAALRERLAEVQSEYAEFKKAAAESADWGLEQNRARADLNERLAEAERDAPDAARYRWIRGNGAIISRAVGVPVHLACFGIGLDTAIDAAMKERAAKRERRK